MHNDNILKTDYLVVGGGIVGAAVTYFLSLFKQKVILVEKDSIGSGATGLSAGTIFCAGYGNRSNTDLTASMESRTLLKNLDHIGYDCGFRETGALTIATSKAESAYLKSMYHKDYLLNNYDIQLIDSPGALRLLEPNISPRITTALYSPLSCHVEPMLACQAIANASYDLGANVIENAEMKYFKKNGNEYIVKFKSDLEIHAKSIIFATNYGSF